MSDTEKPADPKEAMRQALERKKAANHASSAAGAHGEGKVSGGPHKAAASKRVFRRKAGG
ncbi:DUF5302 family protein [Aestuariimicrobium ganziense]|uniref:DUF5302 family protein n=1 Tax=Aestuariimicrobium ganziense TaxID=2773677 RepID=UPI0019406B0E|nr:DUF5302 family protein [Aestuariimicrobium ganziense]